jgi:hypothetical protein
MRLARRSTRPGREIAPSATDPVRVLEYAATGRAFNVALKGDAVAAGPSSWRFAGTGFLLLITCANVANLFRPRRTETRNVL